MKRFIHGSSAARLEGYPSVRSSPPAFPAILLFGLAYWLGLGLVLCAVAAPSPGFAGKNQPARLIAQEIRFISKDAGEVELIWGVNGWKTLPEAQRPAGTVIQKAVMHTPMTKQDDHFAATLLVEPGTMLDFGFLITRTHKGVDVQVWEGDGADVFHEKADPHRIVKVHSRASLLQSGKAPPDGWNSLPYLMIAIVCVVLPLNAAVLLIRRRHKKWDRRILLPAFTKPPRPTKAGDATLIGISLVVGFVSAEVILHIMDLDGGFGAARQLEWVRTGGQEVDKSIMIDPVLGLRPRLTHGPYNDYGTLTNPYSIEKSPGTVRVLVLGGRAVFEGRLVEALRRSYSEDRVEIWNGGVASYGTMQTINFYRQYQSKIQPDKIILFIASGDIETTPIAYRDSRQNMVALVPYSARSSLSPFLFTHSHLYRLVAGLRTLIGDPQETVLQEIRAGLLDLVASLKHDRKELLVVSLPLLYPEEMWSAEEKERHAAVLTMLRITDIPHIDLLPPFRAALDENLAVRRYPGNPFEPTPNLAERFIAYLNEHGLAQRIIAGIDH